MRNWRHGQPTFAHEFRHWAAIPAIVSGAGAVAGASASATAAGMTRDQAAFNKTLSDQQATAIDDQTAVQVYADRDKAKRLAGTQRVGYLKSGITLDGTAADVMYDTAIQTELAALTDQYKGRIAASFSRKQGALGLYEGTAKAGVYDAQATGDLLGGAGSALTAYGKATNKIPTF